MKKNIQWLLITTLVLLIIPELAFAADPYWGKLVAVLKPTTSDISVGVLQQLFGTVNDVLGQGTATVFGQMFGLFNGIMITIAGFALTYATVKAITDIATEGQVMKGISHWIAARTALSFVLLAPTKATGYSLINSMVMWIILQGIGFADIIWTHALDYIYAGGAFVATPSPSPGPNKPAGGAVENKYIYVTDAKDQQQSFSLDILRSQVCLNGLANLLQKERDIEYKAFKSKCPKPGASDVCPLIESEYKKVEDLLRTSVKNGGSADEGMWPTRVTDDEFGLETFPYIRFPHKYSYTYYMVKDQDYNFKVTTPKSLQLDGICGSYTWYWPPSFFGKTTPDTEMQSNIDKYRNYIALKSVALLDMTSTFDGTAKDAIQQQNSGTLDWPAPPTSSTEEWPKDFTGPMLIIESAGANYQASIYPGRVAAVDSSNAKQKQFYENAKATGWILAGSYFQLVGNAQLQASIDTKNDTFLVYKYSGATSDGYPPAIDPSAGDMRINTTTNKIFPIFSDFTQPATDPKFTSLAAQFRSLFTDLLTWTDTSGLGALKYADKLSQGNVPPSPDNPYDKSKSGFALLGNAMGIVGWGGLEKYRPVGVTDTYSKAKASILVPLIGLISPLSIVAAPATLVTAGLFIPSLIGIIGSNLTDNWNTLMIENKHLDGTPFAFVPATPILKIKELGGAMLDNVVDAWGALQGVLYAVYGVSTVASWIYSMFAVAIGFGSFMGGTVGETNATIVIGSAIQTSFKAVEMALLAYQPLLMAISVPIFTMGFLLNVYVPFLPWIIWVAAVISWIINVFETMLASGFMALLLSYPEGQHHMWGKVEHAFAMAVGAFAYPALLVVGFLLAMSVNIFALEVMNFGFAAVAKGFLGVAGSSIIGDFKGTTGAVRWIGAMVIYTFAVVALISQLFTKCVIEFPDRIMSLVFRGEAPQMGRISGEAVLGETKQAAERAGQAGGEAGRGVSEQAARHVTPEVPKMGKRDGKKFESPTGGVQDTSKNKNAKK